MSGAFVPRDRNSTTDPSVCCWKKLWSAIFVVVVVVVVVPSPPLPSAALWGVYSNKHPSIITMHTFVHSFTLLFMSPPVTTSHVLPTCIHSIK